VKRKFRLTRSTDFQRVRRLGRSYAHPLIVLIAFPDAESQPSLFGVAAGRSLGTAVKRNRAKRLLRSALQPYLSSVLPGWKIVLIARRPVLAANCPQVQAVLKELLLRAHLLRIDNGQSTNGKT
jgi:ribonuclease P protein component